MTRAGFEFDVRPTDVDEELEGDWDPTEAARELAGRKAMAGARVRVDEDPTPALVIGSDTIVAAPVGDGWVLLGKPADEGEAAAMLRTLSDTTHRVVTGVSVVAVPGLVAATDSETTEVTMRALSDAEVAAYVESGEWRDKAGGYAIQESADRFVTKLAGGGFDNVVGLPVALTRELLERRAREEGWPCP